MAFNFQTVTESMDTAYSQIESTVGDLTSALTTLESQLEASLPGWTGGASNAYQGLQMRWNTDQQRMTEALKNLAHVLWVSSNNYKRTEEANTMPS